MSRLALLAALLTGCLAAGGCGHDPDDAPTFPEVAVNEPVDADASITGTILFRGQPPPRRRIPTPDAACRRDGREILDETLVVVNGRLRDVLVWIERGAEAWTFAHERVEAAVDQVGCVFVPHVLAVRTHQPIRFHNGDALLHNVNCSNSREGFARNVTPRQKSFVAQFREPELGKRVTCDLHGNMLMYLHVLAHPWFAVTGPDGAFSIEGLPPGDYTLAARHENLGTQRREVTVAAGGRVNVDFTFSR